MPRPPKLCTIDDCNAKHVGRGYCAKHYSRWRRWGDPLVVKPYGPQRQPDRDGKRFCIACEEWKPLDAFYQDGKNGKGKRHRCKECMTAADREKWATDPEAMQRSRKRHTLRKQYGITLETYEAMRQAQDGTCALCPAREEDAVRLFPVDHDHKTGAVRGLLCGRCNLALGQVEERGEEWVRRALDYLAAQSDWRTHAA